eukprot:CAMPEP_0181319360 /NCGR_PEP_ID=MMETSP1101-20121128/17525_1 /TAXON_ID=46948 /ORGANISM="Rhodomonas abbreviata, Strain Caron Lab Isolate" /LENGTH=121 /DNA_ID=CAMNT_0023426945 /DNA_START=104 /DNA_END=469 /DNA_ORIENTATION=+
MDDTFNTDPPSSDDPLTVQFRQAISMNNDGNSLALALIPEALSIIHTPNTAPVSVGSSDYGTTIVFPSLDTAATQPEASTAALFVPTDDWRQIPEGQICPAGLEFRMNMSTGKNYARKLQS